MTVVASAVTKKDGIVIAVDSQVTDGDYLKQDGFPYKLWIDQENNYIFGACGSIREIQTLQYHVEWPKFRPDEHELMKFAITEIVPAIRSGLDDLGVLSKSKGVESLESSFIMAWEDNMIHIGPDFCVFPNIKGRMADGSGYAEALGALGDKGPWTKEDVIEAARRATLTAQGVGGDIYWVSTKNLIIQKA